MASVGPDSIGTESPVQTLCSHSALGCQEQEAQRNGIGTPVVPKKKPEEGSSMPDSSRVSQDVEVVQVRLAGKRKQDELKRETEEEASMADVLATPRPFTRRRLSSKTPGSSVKCQASKQEDEDKDAKAKIKKEEVKTEKKDLNVKAEKKDVKVKLDVNSLKVKLEKEEPTLESKPICHSELAKGRAPLKKEKQVEAEKIKDEELVVEKKESDLKLKKETKTEQKEQVSSADKPEEFDGAIAKSLTQLAGRYRAELKGGSFQKEALEIHHILRAYQGKVEVVKKEVGASSLPQQQSAVVANESEHIANSIEKKINKDQEDGGNVASGSLTPMDVIVKKEAAGVVQSVATREENADHAVECIDSSYAARVPLWIKRCLKFQKDDNAWLPHQPCCLPNCWLQPRRSPTARRQGDSAPVACYLQMTKEERRSFRTFIESDDAEKGLPCMATHGLWTMHLHPERPMEAYHYENLGSTEPRGKELVTPELWKVGPWMRDLPSFMWRGDGWMLEEDGVWRNSNQTSSTSAQEGRGSSHAAEQQQSDEQHEHQPSSCETCLEQARIAEENVKLPQGVEFPMLLVKQNGQVCMVPDPRVKVPCHSGGKVSQNEPRASKSHTKKRCLQMARLQCEVAGVAYNASKDRWVVMPHTKGKQSFYYFSTKKFKTNENTWLEARYEAMQAAISKMKEFRAFHKDGEKEKALKEAKGKAGAKVKRGLKKAVVENNNKKKKKKLSARPPPPPRQRQRAGAGKREEGATAEAAAGAAAARGATAAAAAASAAVGGAPRGSEPPDESQQSDCYGRGSVRWHKGKSGFEARICFKSDGRRHTIGYFRPKDGSARELERARQAAWDAIERRRRDPNYKCPKAEKRMPSLDEIALGKAPPEYDAD